MKKVLLILTAVLLFSSSPALAAGAWTGDINLLIGQKTLDKDDWEPLDEQGEAGLELNIKQADWPVHLVVASLSSDKTETYDSPYGSLEITGETSEFHIGVKKIWDQTSARPYVGGGIAFISAEISASLWGLSASDSGSGTGYWLGGGIMFLLGEHFNLGLDLKRSAAEVDIGGVNGEAGGLHTTLILGYHW